MKEDYVNRVVKVKRVQDRIMRLKLEIKGVIVECVYAPKGWIVGRERGILE